MNYIMKGILYGNFLLNKKWFVAAGITAALGTVLCALLVKLVPDNGGVAAMLFLGLQLMVVTITMEWLGRNLEANIKCRFTDVTLAGGISKNMFVMSELLKNLITIGIGLLICVIMQLVMNIFSSGFFTLETVKTMAVIALFIGAIEWVVNPLVIALKSAEKAGLLVGIVLGFGIVLPLMAIGNYFSYIYMGESAVSVLIRMLSGSPLIVVGISAVLYAVFYFVLLARVKKETYADEGLDLKGYLRREISDRRRCRGNAAPFADADAYGRRNGGR